MNDTLYDDLNQRLRRKIDAAVSRWRANRAEILTDDPKACPRCAAIHLHPDTMAAALVEARTEIERLQERLNVPDVNKPVLSETWRLMDERDEARAGGAGVGPVSASARAAAEWMTRARAHIVELEAEVAAWDKYADALAIADSRVVALRAERDRYREALERIALDDYRGPEPWYIVIARTALDEEGT